VALESRALPRISVQAGLVAQTLPATPGINDIFSLFALGERFRDASKHVPSAFFQDANYHVQIFNDRERAKAAEPSASRSLVRYANP